ncbi:MAG: hypothetical protein M1815_004146 [Lichina confinis]|nr:MAG: hypothetical protein M1815_004146 [Lichina confinis]
MASAPTASVRANSAGSLYGGFTRFELELEFVQSLANPNYLNHLAATQMFDDPCFVAYLDYLQYFTRPEYTKFLTYPLPTLKALQLLQQKRFRQDILSPDTVAKLRAEFYAVSVPG